MKGNLVVEKLICSNAFITLLCVFIVHAGVDGWIGNNVFQILNVVSEHIYTLFFGLVDDFSLLR